MSAEGLGGEDPQLERFKTQPYPQEAIAGYLLSIRGYIIARSLLPKKSGGTLFLGRSQGWECVKE
jgi:hypothetical protein